MEDKQIGELLRAVAVCINPDCGGEDGTGEPCPRCQELLFSAFSEGDLEAVEDDICGSCDHAGRSHDPARCARRACGCTGHNPTGETSRRPICKRCGRLGSVAQSGRCTDCGYQGRTPGSRYPDSR